MSIAITLAKFLLDRNIPYELVSHPHTETALSSATASRLAPDSVVKAVVLKKTDGFMLALLPASRQIKFDALRSVLGRDVDIASEEQVEPLFMDCEPGSVPALGAAYGLDVVIDDSLAQKSELYLEAGDHENLVHISGASFQKLTRNARHGPFS